MGLRIGLGTLFSPKVFRVELPKIWLGGGGGVKQFDGIVIQWIIFLVVFVSSNYTVPLHISHCR